MSVQITPDISVNQVVTELVNNAEAGLLPAPVSYAGWVVRTGFHKSDWLTWLGAEAEPHFNTYVSMLFQRLQDEFPDARIEITWDENTTGALPLSLQTRVMDDDDNGQHEVEWYIEQSLIPDFDADFMGMLN